MNASPSSLPSFFSVFIENGNFTYHIKHKTAHYVWALFSCQGTDFVCILQALCEMSYPQTKQNTTQHLDCPEERFQGQPKGSRSQTGGICEVRRGHGR